MATGRRPSPPPSCSPDATARGAESEAEGGSTSMEPEAVEGGVLHALSQHRIAPPPVLGTVLAADLIDQAFLSYNAGRLREVCRVFTRKMLEPRCTVGLAISGALTPA